MSRKKLKVGEERVAELVAKLEIPETIPYSDYPYIELAGTGNIFGDIASATRAWKYIDHGVSKRIMSVINNNCNSPEEVDALLNAISDNS
jgi:hypothetical protein